MLKPLKNKKGMTLIELIVGMLMFTIISASVSAALAPSMNLYFMANNLAETNMLLDNLSHEILNDLWSAIEVTISDTELTIRTDKSISIYDTDTGLLRKDSVPVLDVRYYKGRTVEIKYYGAEDYEDVDADEISGSVTGAFVIRINILASDGSLMAGRFYAVNPLGLASP